MSVDQQKNSATQECNEPDLRLEQRQEISKKFLTGEWSAELEGIEESKVADRTQTKTLDSLLRD